MGADLEGPDGNIRTLGRGGHTRPGYQMWVGLWEDGEKVWMGRSGRFTRLDPGEASGSSSLEEEDVGCCAEKICGWRLVGSGQSQEVGF